MPLYLVSEDGQKDRVISATSQAAALRFVAEPRFKARILSNPMEVAEVVGGGTVVEKVPE